MTGLRALPPPPRLEATVRAGTAAAMRGDFGGAAEAFGEAAAIARRHRRPADEVRCLVLLAQARRLGGDPETALAVIGRARRLARPGDPLRAGVLAEHAEIALAGNDGGAAATLLEEAIAASPTVQGVSGSDAAALAGRHRRFGGVLTTIGDGARADAAFVAAIDACVALGQPKTAGEIAVERATAAWNLRLPGFEAILADARDKAGDPPNPLALGQIDVLEAAVATTDGRLDNAEALLRSARDRALAAVDPVLYSGAVFALADVIDARGDRVGAYDAIAAGWATLGDLLGGEAAAQVFRPKLGAFETAWGTDAFLEVKTAWTERRRAAGADTGAEAGGA